MTLLEAIAALPFKLTKWRESVDRDGHFEILVTCEKPDGVSLHVVERVVLPPEATLRSIVQDARPEFEKLVGAYRARIVEAFCHSHPEGLPRGLANLGTGKGL